MTEEDDGFVKSNLIWCSECAEPFVIQRGPQIKDWYLEAKEQL